MAKSKILKIWKAFLGIATELIVTGLFLAVGFGLCWVLVRMIK